VNEDKLSKFEETLALFTLSPIDFYMILLCAVLFFLFLKLADKLLFTPFVKLYEAREQATEGAGQLATSQSTEAEKLTAQYETELTEARIESMQKKLSVLKEARDSAQSILSAAESDVRAFLNTEREKQKEQQEKLLDRLSGEVETLSSSIVERLLDTQPTQSSYGSH